jgi:KH domain
MDPRKRRFDDETPQGSRPSQVAEFPVKGPNYLKFLLPEKVAGMLIGKAGSSITELENKSGASIKLAPSGSCYPRTSERTVSVGGTMKAIDEVMFAVSNAIKEYSGVSPPFLLKMVIPSTCASGIIGRNGEVIRDITQQTGTTIRISKDEKEPERIADITGGERGIFNASMAVAAKIQDFPNLYEYSSVLHPAPINPSAPAPQQPRELPREQPRERDLPHREHREQREHYLPQSPPPQPIQPPMEVFNYTCTIQFLVPTPAIPTVEVLADIYQQTAARVTVSDSPGNDLDKTLTLTGPMAGVQAAHILLIRRVGDFLHRQETEQQRYVPVR